MSLIVQFGTTSVGYTPTLNTTLVNTSSGNRTINFRSQTVPANQPAGVAKHRLPMQINRQPQQINRSLVTQQHVPLHSRNIAALARPIAQSITMARPQPQQPQNQNSLSQQQSQTTLLSSAPVTSSLSSSASAVQAIISNSIAGRVLASPVKDSTLDDDLLEGVVEKRPKYHKHLPLNYQYVLQDHNYGAPPPPTPPSVPSPKPVVNGANAANGVVRNQSLIAQQSSGYMQHSYSSRSTLPGVFGIGTRGPPPDESDVESSDGEREVDPQGEETETAPEGEGDDEDSVTRCICDFQHDDGYMISCDKCLVWQHVDCMGIDRSNIPDEYLCEKCQPRRIDKQRAIALQLRKRQELLDTSDSSSDTSSSSESNVVNSVPVRKHAMPVANRRRSEPVQRKSNTGNNHNSKQKRENAKDSHGFNSSRQTNKQMLRRKREVEKRPPARRKSTPVTSSSSVQERPAGDKKLVTPILSPDNGSNVQQLRQWIDSYEEAVTNHYSPELRARIASIKVNGVHSDLKLPQNLMATPKCRVSLLPSGIKILVSCVALASNQPLLELRGKYMLCGASAPNRPPRPAAPPPGPHIFHYKLPRDNTEVCVDARTYGNDARFVRRSCKPNAEVRHCIEKGTLHLYLVTTKNVDKNTEITLPHVVAGAVQCACGDSGCPGIQPQENSNKIQNIVPATNNTNNTNSINNNNSSKSDKRRRGRRRTISENLTLSKPVPKPTAKVSPIPKAVQTTKGTSKVLVSPVPPQQATSQSITVQPPLKSPVEQCPPSPSSLSKPSTPPLPPPKQPPPLVASSPPSLTVTPNTRSVTATVAARKILPSHPKKEIQEHTNKVKREPVDKKKKMTREERKMEAIMKAFERMEKDQARKQEVQARQAQRKDSTDMDHKPVHSDLKDVKSNGTELLGTVNKGSQKRRRLTSARRKGRGKSQNMNQPNLRPRHPSKRIQRVSSQKSQSTESGQSSDDGEQCAQSSPQHSSTPPREVRTPTPPNTLVTQGMSSAAGLLMEFSKQDDKYTVLDKSYESPVNMNSSGHSTSSSDTPPTPMSKTCMLVAAAVGPLAPGFKFPKTKKGMLNSWIKSPESSPPAPLCSPPAPPDELPVRPGPGFAKKRWLRQAISEECDSPNSRPDMSVSPTDYVAPLKKRRLARESLSSEQSFTPPATPTHIHESTVQMNYEDEDETILSPPEHKELQEQHSLPDNQDDMGGTSQDSDGPESPVGGPRTPSEPEPKTEHESTKVEESECDDDLYSEGINSTNSRIEGVKENVDIKEEINEKEEHDSKEQSHSLILNTAEKQHILEQPSATKRKLSISEYRQRKQQGSGNVREDCGMEGDQQRPLSPATSATSSMSSSSSDEEDETPNVLTKSLLLEAALDTNLGKKGTAVSRFSSVPTLAERQRENLTERLKREFGLFLSDDEDQEKVRKQSVNVEIQLQKGKEKDTMHSVGKKKLPPPPPPPLPPPPPPLEPPSASHYPVYYPTVGRHSSQIYTSHYSSTGQNIPPPPTLIEPPYYTPSSSINTYYSQLPH